MTVVPDFPTNFLPASTTGIRLTCHDRTPLGHWNSVNFLPRTVVPEFPTNFQRTPTSRLRLTSLARRPQETLLFGFGARRLADYRDNFGFLRGGKLAHPDLGNSPLLVDKHQSRSGLHFYLT